MPLPDFVKRIINDVFLQYDWEQRMPVDQVVNPAMSDVFVDQCSARCAADMMEQVEMALASDGQGVTLTDGEKKLVRFKLLEACRTHCERSVEMDIEQQNISEELMMDSLTDGGPEADMGDRSPEDYTENIASESYVQPEIDGINIQLIPIEDDTEEE